MSGVYPELESVVTELQAADIRATTDGSALNLPGVWVSVDHLEPELLDGSGSVLVALNLVAANIVTRTAYQQLDELLVAVMSLRPTMAVEGDVVPESVILPDNPQTLPSYRLLVRRYYTL